MLFTLNAFPSNWTPTAFQQVATLRVSYPQLRAAGLKFTTGDDELGVFDQAVISVNGHPLIFQHYTKPDRGEFSLEAPRKVALDTKLLSSLVDGLFKKLSISPSQIIWCAENLGLLTGPGVASPVVEFSRGIASSLEGVVYAHAYIPNMYKTIRSSPVSEEPTPPAGKTRRSEKEPK
jgi:hypothetical protein